MATLLTTCAGMLEKEDEVEGLDFEDLEDVEEAVSASKLHVNTTNFPVVVPINIYSCWLSWRVHHTHDLACPDPLVTSW